jgi:hypothetical protein
MATLENTVWTTQWRNPWTATDYQEAEVGGQVYARVTVGGQVVHGPTTNLIAAQRYYRTLTS